MNDILLAAIIIASVAAIETMPTRNLGTTGRPDYTDSFVSFVFFNDIISKVEKMDMYIRSYPDQEHYSRIFLISDLSKFII